MRTFCKPLLAALLVVAPIFAGALVLQIGNPTENPEAQAHHAVLVARITACRSPGKTTVTAMAEGVEDGVRKSIPLKLIPLTMTGTFAVTRGWPEHGAWLVRLVATNPDYKDYASAILIPAEKNTLQWTAAKRLFHVPTDTEVAAMLTYQSDLARNATN